MNTTECRSAAPVPVLFVSGAPGAGKSAVAQALLDLRTDALVFDADWLLEPTSHLVERSMAEADDLWPAYDRLWVAILDMVRRNRQPVVLFTPMEPRSLPPTPWSACAHWCLLDCDDQTRTLRLKARGWTVSAMMEALADARALRDQVGFVVDTRTTSAREAAARVAEWIHAHAHHDTCTG